jgi:hypothetical protein
VADRDRLKAALQPNAEGKYDGVEVLAALSGQSRDEVKARWEAIKAQAVRTDACTLHELLPTGETSKRWRCGACGWEPEAGSVLAYEQGLKHGRAHESGGGRG